MKVRKVKLIVTMSISLAISAPLQGQERVNDSPAALPTSPVPLINLPLVPDAITPGAAGFTLTVNGTGFVLGSVVKWNGSTRTTTFVSSSQLKASILAADIARPSTAAVTVVSPIPGGMSNMAFFEVTPSSSSMALSPASTFGAGSSPFSVAVGDFNRDGKLDVAAANTGDSDVSILLGNGDGTFNSARSYSTGSYPVSVAVGDFNGDGMLDLVVANYQSDNVSVLLGHGDGTFQAAVNYGVGFEPRWLAVGDFNRDGKLDVVVANYSSSNGSGNISVLLGRGDGTLQAAMNYDAGVNPFAVAVGDFNGDGNLDLAVSNFTSNNVSILLGNGDGTFQSPVNYEAGQGPISVAVGDFNHDGKLDLAVANNGNGNGGDISMLLGEGNGVFQPAVHYFAGSVPTSLAVGDFNGDGKLDLAVSNNASNNVSLLLGNGDGTFKAAVSYSATSEPQSVAVGDFNDDGRLDVVLPDSMGSTVSVLLQGPSVLLSTSTLPFPDQVIGTNSASKTVTLTAGFLPVGIDNITITGTNATDFSETNTCGIGIAAGSKCTISVTFTPAKTGPWPATLTITDSAVGSPQSVALSGTGVTAGPNATLSRASISFATQLVGTTSPAQSFTLINYGVTPLSITGIAVTGTNTNDFAQTHNCGGSLATGARCNISVTFKPTASGNRTAAVSITDNAPGSPQKVALSGVGTVAKLSPPGLSFNSVVIDTTSPSQTVTLTNVGTTSLSIMGIGINGTNAGDFAQTHTCGSSLIGGASCSIFVTFKPTALGTRTAALSVSDNGGGSPQSIGLGGTGVAGFCIPYGRQCDPFHFPTECCPGLHCYACGLRDCCR